MRTKTRIKGVTNTQLGVAVIALFLAGGLAFASLPFSKNTEKQKNRKSPVLSANSDIKSLLPVTNKQKIIQKNNTATPPRNLPNVNLNNGPITLRTVVCRTRWTPETVVLDEAEIRAQVQELSRYYSEVLFGKVNIVLSDIVTSTLWNGQNRPTTYYEEIASLVEMCDPFIDYANVDLVITYPTLQVMASYGTKSTIHTNEGVMDKPIVQVAAGQLSTYVLSHEVGHAVFRLYHASMVECGDATFRQNYENCVVRDYQNMFDVMGKSVGHFGAWNKYLAGNAFGKEWIQTQVVNRDGEYPLKVLELPTEGKQLLRIPYQIHPLCIEYRKPLGIDGALRDQLAGAAYGSLESIPENGGLLLNFCYTYTPSERTPDLPFDYLLPGAAVLLDPYPHATANITDQERDYTDIFLREGDVFSNDALGINISWQRGEENTATVQLNIDEERL